MEITPLPPIHEVILNVLLNYQEHFYNQYFFAAVIVFLVVASIPNFFQKEENNDEIENEDEKEVESEDESDDSSSNVEIDDDDTEEDVRDETENKKEKTEKITIKILKITEKMKMKINLQKIMSHIQTTCLLQIFLDLHKFQIFRIRIMKFFLIIIMQIHFQNSIPIPTFLLFRQNQKKTISHTIQLFINTMKFPLNHQ